MIKTNIKHNQTHKSTLRYIFSIITSITFQMATTPENVSHAANRSNIISPAQQCSENLFDIQIMTITVPFPFYFSVKKTPNLKIYEWMKSKTNTAPQRRGSRRKVQVIYLTNQPASDEPRLGACSSVVDDVYLELFLSRLSSGGSESERKSTHAGGY